MHGRASWLILPCGVCRDTGAEHRIELDARLDEARRIGLAAGLVVQRPFDLDADRAHQAAIALGARQDVHHARERRLHVDRDGHGAKVTRTARRGGHGISRDDRLRAHVVARAERQHAHQMRLVGRSGNRPQHAVRRRACIGDLEAQPIARRSDLIVPRRLREQPPALGRARVRRRERGPEEKPRRTGKRKHRHAQQAD